MGIQPDQQKRGRARAVAVLLAALVLVGCGSRVEDRHSVAGGAPEPATAPDAAAHDPTDAGTGSAPSAATPLDTSSGAATPRSASGSASGSSSVTISSS